MVSVVLRSFELSLHENPQTNALEQNGKLPSRSSPSKKQKRRPDMNPASIENSAHMI